MNDWEHYRRRQTSVSFSIFIYTLLFCIAFAILLSWVSPSQAEDYDRAKHFGGWIDLDHDCQNTRQEVLISESLGPVVLSDNGCKVLSGFWRCEFTGEYFTDPRKLDIDHRVPLKEAWLSGADQWTKAERIAYANDLTHPDHLVAVKAGANRSKGAKDPAGWLPHVNHSEYVLKWVDVKLMYHLNFDMNEAMVIWLAK